MSKRSCTCGTGEHRFDHWGKLPGKKKERTVVCTRCEAQWKTSAKYLGEIGPAVYKGGYWWLPGGTTRSMRLIAGSENFFSAVFRDYPISAKCRWDFYGTLFAMLDFRDKVCSRMSDEKVFRECCSAFNILSTDLEATEQSKKENQ